MSITQFHGSRLRDNSVELSKLSAAVQSTLDSVAGKASAQALGDLSQLLTINKSSAVKAINEVKNDNSDTVEALFGYVGKAGTTKIETDFTYAGEIPLPWVGGVPTANAGEGVVTGLIGVGMGLAARIGDLATLNTTSKTSAVAAINELKTAVDSKQAALGYTAENAANKGVAGGYASLDETGKVPASQLPSYVDDVIESADFAALPASGESGKIYVTLDNGNIYRWSGSAYLQIGQDVGSADTALKLATARNIALGGELSGSAAFDGSGDVVINATMSAAALAAHFVSRATVSGAVDGLNKEFKLLGKELVAGTEHVFLDGQLMEPGADADYVLSTSFRAEIVSGKTTYFTDTAINFVVAPPVGSRVRISGIKA